MSQKKPGQRSEEVKKVHRSSQGRAQKGLDQRRPGQDSEKAKKRDQRRPGHEGSEKAAQRSEVGRTEIKEKQGHRL